jgi:uncharacterized protein
LKSAEQRYAHAQVNLMWMFANGNGVAKDEMRVLEWFLKSAKQGFAHEQCNLGLMFLNRNGVAKDEMRAFK